MTIEQFRKLVALVQARCIQLDREQFDHERQCDTVTHADMYKQAAREIVKDEDWVDTVRVVAQGGFYYGWEE